MAISDVEWKRGSSFGINCLYVPSEGDPPLSSLEIYSQVLDHQGIRHSMTVTKIDSTHFTVIFDGDTSGWGVGSAALDYRLLYNGIVIYTQTERFTIEEQITLEN